MQPKKITNYECHYPRIKEDSAYHYENCDHSYTDSVTAYYDSLRADYMLADRWVRDEDGDLHQVWIPKVGKLVEENLDYIGLQDYIVPSFFALMTMVLIFGVVVIKDSKKGEKEKVKESILGFMSEEDS